MPKALRATGNRLKSLIAGMAVVTGALVVLPAATASAAPTRYEAESAPAACTGTIDSNWAGFSGSGFCNGTNAVGAAAQFTVTASGSGTATLGVRFANGTTTARPAGLIVNGSTVQTPSFEGTGAWSTWATKTLTVAVNAGSNTIRLNPTTSNGLPNIDYLDVEVGGQPPPPPPPPPGGLVGWATQAGGTTGGEGGQLVDVDTESEFLAVVESATRQIIRVSGMIPIDGMVEVGSNKTIIGVGANSGFTGGGLTVENGVGNVIIRNLNFRGSDDDGVNVEESAHHVWIDHNDISGTADGTIDIKRGADFITVSWNHTHGQTKDMLLGHSDGNGGQDRGHLRVTYHHNWYDGTAERHPRVRFGNPVHVFNNYVANADYGVASTVEAGVLVENNYFENVVRPLAMGVFESEPGSMAHRGNVFVNSGPPEQGGSVNPIPYSYTLDPGANVKSLVLAGAGTGRS